MLTSISNLISSAQGIALLISSLLMTVAFIVFLLAVIFYINKRRSGDSDGFRQAGNMLLGSVFALFVMVAVWGMVFFISNALGIGVGGCTSRPSSLPGVANNIDCGTGSSGARVSAVPESKVSSQVKLPQSRSVTGNNGGSGDNTSLEINPEADNKDFNCRSGSARRAQNGDILYCISGESGDICKTGTCRIGECLKSDQSLTYGICGS
jgi:hypothetical protein